MQIKTITKEVYIAPNGAEFDTKKDCLDYEYVIKQDIKNYWDKTIYKVEVEPMTLGYSWDSEDYYDYVFEIRNQIDVNVLNKMLKFYGNVWQSKPFTPEDIGKKYVAILEYSDDIMDGNDVDIFEYEPLWQKLCDTHNKVEAFFKQEI